MLAQSLSQASELEDMVQDEEDEEVRLDATPLFFGEKSSEMARLSFLSLPSAATGH